jgi:hypothetical protein
MPANFLSNQVANTAFAVSPNDGAVIEASMLYVGVGGDVAVTMFDGGNVTFQSVPGGTFMLVRVTKVLATGTSATGIIGLA